MFSEKRHIYVDKEFADKYEELESSKGQAEIAKEILAAKKIDISKELDQLDDDMVRFKSVCLIHKQELAKVYDEQNDLVEKLISEMWDCKPQAQAAAVKLAAEIEPLSSIVNALETSVTKLKGDLNSLDIYGMDRLIELTEKLSSLDSASLEIFKFLTVNYTREKS